MVWVATVPALAYCLLRLWPRVQAQYRGIFAALGVVACADYALDRWLFPNLVSPLAVAIPILTFAPPVDARAPGTDGQAELAGRRDL